MSQYIITILVKITVTNGQGSGSFNLVGKVNRLVIASADDAVYDIEIVNSVGRGVYGNMGEGLPPGPRVILGVDTLCVQNHTMHIFNASDGDYTCEIVAEEWGIKL